MSTTLVIQVACSFDCFFNSCTCCSSPRITLPNPHQRWSSVPLSPLSPFGAPSVVRAPRCSTELTSALLSLAPFTSIIYWAQSMIQDPGGCDEGRGVPSIGPVLFASVCQQWVYRRCWMHSRDWKHWLILVFNTPAINWSTGDWAGNPSRERIEKSVRWLAGRGLFRILGWETKFAKQMALRYFTYKNYFRILWSLI